MMPVDYCARGIIALLSIEKVNKGGNKDEFF